jgi:hypothetical protein
MRKAELTENNELPLVFCKQKTEVFFLGQQTVTFEGQKFLNVESYQCQKSAGKNLFI